MLDIQPIKDRLAAATPGPWRCVRDDPNEYVISIATVNDEILITMPNDVVCSTPEDDADLIANAPADLAALVAEVERLRAQIDELVNPENAELVSFVDGAFAFHSEVFRTLLAGLVMMLDKAGAENYCQIEVAAGTRDAVVLTIQRKAGKTPHDLRREAEAEVERLRGAIKAHRASLDTEDGLVDDSDRKLWAVLNA